MPFNRTIPLRFSGTLRLPPVPTEAERAWYESDAPRIAARRVAQSRISERAAKRKPFLAFLDVATNKQTNG